MGFSDEDKIGTIQPYDDALVITFQIGGYDVKRVMVDQGSAAEIMYPDLYKGLNLKAEDLMPYSSPLVSFKGKIIIPKGQVRLLAQTGSKVVKVDFIIIDAYSPYTAVSSTLQQKVKYPPESQIKEILGDQALAKQCMVAAIQHKLEAESLVRGKKGLQQLKSSALSIDKPVEDVKCEDLVKVVIGDDLEKFFFFRLDLSYLIKKEKS